MSSKPSLFTTHPSQCGGMCCEIHHWLFSFILTYFTPLTHVHHAPYWSITFTLSQLKSSIQILGPPHIFSMSDSAIPFNRFLCVHRFASNPSIDISSAPSLPDSSISQLQKIYSKFYITIRPHYPNFLIKIPQATNALQTYISKLTYLFLL